MAPLQTSSCVKSLCQDPVSRVTSSVTSLSAQLVARSKDGEVGNAPGRFFRTARGTGLPRERDKSSADDKRANAALTDNWQSDCRETVRMDPCRNCAPRPQDHCEHGWRDLMQPRAPLLLKTRGTGCGRPAHADAPDPGPVSGPGGCARASIRST